ncbi:GNAT family N-acetyltransferase [Roseibium album]|uniref:GNAT family N-acetyltransferase n=2 Tax=Roseibium album TaxID=311410 RepID=UPI002491144B|nr:GNAT family N-acetyltransferase [Roseibium album]
MIETRPINSNDLDLVCRHRISMFCDDGRRKASELETMDRSFRAWLKPRLVDGTYFGFIVEDDGKPIAGIGLMELSWPPHPLHQDDGRRGYVLNMFVERSHRKRGIAKLLLDLADQEFSQRKLKYAILHSTSAGRPVYEAAGWQPTSEMAKVIE